MSPFRPAIRPARGDPMSFELRLGRHVSTEIKRIATEQTSTALAELREIERSCHDYEQFAGVVDEAVHTTRKALKKTRATLRLVRNEVGEEVYQRENASYRDAGRALSEMRDVYVRAQTLGGMRESLADQDIEGAVAEIQAMLANRHRAHRRQLFEERGPVEEATALIESAQRRIKAWPIREDATTWPCAMGCGGRTSAAAVACEMRTSTLRPTDFTNGESASSTTGATCAYSSNSGRRC